MIKTIIFDFDGVILDSNRIKEDAFAELYKDYGSIVRKKVVEYHKKNLGMPRYDKFRFYNKNYLKDKESLEDIENLSLKFSKIIYKKIINVNFILGAYEFISQNFRNYKFHISSATPDKELIRICKKRKIDKYFVSINGSTFTKKDHIKKIINSNKIRLNEIVYIGDSINDFLAAKSFDINFIKIGKKDNGINYKKIFFLKNLLNLSKLINEL